MKYNQPFGVADPDAAYVNGDPSIGRAGSIPPAQAMEAPQREIVEAIVASGQTPSANDLGQLWKAIQRTRGQRYAIDTGTANTLAIALNPALSAYAEGQSFLVKVAHDNTAATTLNINSLGNKPILRQDGAALAPGDLREDGIALVAYDGASFQLIGSTGGGGSYPPFSFWHYGMDGGPANTLSVNVAPDVVAYEAGLTVLVKPGHANTGPASINVDGLGAKAIYRGQGGALQIGDIAAGVLAILCYDGTQFQLVNPQVIVHPEGGGEVTLPDNWKDISGMLRPYFMAVISAALNAPPASPGIGDAYLIPATGASGAWAGLGNRVAQWTGPSLGWVYRDYPVQSMIGVAETGDFLKRSATGWRSIFATVAEAKAGTSEVLAVTPKGLSAAIADIDLNLAITDYVHSEMFFLGSM